MFQVKFANPAFDDRFFMSLDCAVKTASEYGCGFTVHNGAGNVAAFYSNFNKKVIYL